MEALRSEKVTVNLTPGTAARIDALGKRSRWTRSTATAVAIERGLEVIEAEESRDLQPVREQARGSAA
jgi:hypothetical protein